MKKRSVLLAMVLLLCLVLCACGDESGQRRTEPGSESTDPTGEPVYGGQIVVGIAQDLDDSLDPHLAVAAGTKEVLFNLFEGLVKPDPTGELLPAIAESYTVDGATYTFTIRDGVQFHNGQTVTAEDVVYSIERCADDTEGGPLIPALSVIQTVEAIDPHTVILTIEEENLEFISYLTLAILPAGYEGQATAPVGTGPFRYVSRSPQQNVVIEKFDEYWGKSAYLDKVTYQIMENADAMVLSLKSGAVDICSHLTAVQAAEVSDRFTIWEGTMNLVQALYLNHDVEPLNNQTVRQALCHAVDKQLVMDMIADGGGVPVGSSMYPAFAQYFVPALADAYPYNPVLARELLAQAGYADGFELRISVPSNYQPHVDTAQVLAQLLEEVNVRVQVELVDWSTWVEQIYLGRQFQSTVVGVDAPQLTARAMLERFTSGAADNFINYRNATYDDVFEQAITSTDREEQTALYQQLQAILSQTAANVYLQDMADFVAMNPVLDGLTFYPIYVLDLARIHFVA